MEYDNTIKMKSTASFPLRQQSQRAQYHCIAQGAEKNKTWKQYDRVECKPCSGVTWETLRTEQHILSRESFWAATQKDSRQADSNYPLL